MSEQLTPSELLKPAIAAGRMKVAVGTLSQWRHHRRYALKFVRVGRRIFYRAADVEQWISDNLDSGEPKTEPIKRRKRQPKRAHI
jgi:hypothetical protein